MLGKKKAAMLGVSLRSSQILSLSLAGLGRLPSLGHPQSMEHAELILANGT